MNHRKMKTCTVTFMPRRPLGLQGTFQIGPGGLLGRYTFAGVHHIFSGPNFFAEFHTFE